MSHKLIMALIRDDISEAVLDAAHDAGATGSTIINNARGEGAARRKTFFGLEMTSQTDVLLFVVEADQAQVVLSAIRDTAEFHENKGAGLAFLLDIESIVGI